MGSNSSYVSPFQELRRRRFRLEASPLTFFEVTGADALSWLQGQLTNDVRKLAPNGPLNACMCSPTGQIVAILTLWQVGERIIIGVHNLGVEAVLDRFDRMVILEDVAIQALPHSVAIVHSFQTVDIDDNAEFALELDQVGSRGFALLFASEQMRDEWIDASIPAIDDQTVRVMEVESGRPRFGFDTDAKTLPAELGDNFLSRHVSFDKGCYTGQEVVMRIHSRGHVNRRWSALVGEAPVEVGATILADSVSMGKVLWAGEVGEGSSIASAIVRKLSDADGQIVTVHGEDASVRATLWDLPLYSSG